jgi:hypothetical protein
LKQITVRSDDFNNPSYLSFWNSLISPNREKVDQFWQLETGETGYSTLAHVGHITDELSQLIDGFVEKEVKQEWDMLDENFQPITFVDLKVQPFTNHAWCVTQSGILACYDLDETTMSGIDRISTTTPGADVGIEFNSYHFILGETVYFSPTHLRPVKEINRWRIWYETPSRNKYGL